MRRPRAAVLDEVWRGLDGLAPLSGPQGGPLRRTVKLVLDPLVIRPVQYPACAGPVLDADGIALLTARLHAAADDLRATAAWFTLLKQVRRASKITDGNPQDLYFQRCFELAATRGTPEPLRDRPVAEAALREIHDNPAGRTVAVLRAHLTDPARAAELAALLATAWARRPLTETPTPDHAAALHTLLDACAAARLTDGVDNGLRSFDDLLDAHAGTHAGIELWQVVTGWTAAELGFTARPVPQQPAVGSSAATAQLGRPFDRTVYERVFTVLQGGTERADLPTVPELVAAEVARSCAPLALLDESLRLTATAGIALALGLAPAGVTRPAPDGTPGTEPDATAAHRIVNGRWRREAYVLAARRLSVAGAPGPDAEPLAAIAADLSRPWRPYLRRLWVRLHGRDVRAAPVYDPDELWDLLDGVARSVMLDHRMRVKQVLSARAELETPAQRAG
ncbi:hypothetical protein [Nocardia sp. NPDC057227]|uniref:hypothetical protein n=1 Tax=Nocardia sp. NPDC057227 TaxID=3346056 RepID=UPI0036346EE1